MRGTPSTRTTSSRHRHAGAARRSRSAGVLGALSVVVMAAALGTLVLEDGDSSTAGTVEVAAAAGQATGRNVIGADRGNRPQRSSATPSAADVTTPTTAPAPLTTSEPTVDAAAAAKASAKAAKASAKAAAKAAAKASADAAARAAAKASADATAKAAAKASADAAARAAAKASADAAAKAAAAPPPAPAPAPVATPAQLAASGRTIQAYVTGYTWHDNTPAGSPQISHPIVHRTAGGSGTFDDPITVAVGHDKSSGRSVLDWPAGTRFYVPAFSRYLIVEDTCGDGGSPENGACHTGYPSSASTWLDVWIDGRDAGESASGRCAGAVTGVTAVVVDPAPGLPVKAGPLSSGGGCAV